ncbi:MAG: histidine kinase [Bacteroidota bacterium]
MISRIIIFMGCLLLFLAGLKGQPTVYFNKVGVEEGLNDGGVEAIAQDHLGYIWASTLGGINCYNGKEVTFFDRVHSGKTTMPKTICRSIVSDASGGLYFGYENCLAKFDFTERKLVVVPAFKNQWVYDIFSLLPSLMIVVTSNDWMAFNPEKNEKIPINQVLKDTSAIYRPYAITQNARTLYFTNKKGLFSYNYPEKRLRHFDLPDSVKGGMVMTTDKAGDVWMVTRKNNQLFRYNLATQTLTALRKNIGGGDFSITDIKAHPIDGTIWISTTVDGLWRFDPSNGSFNNYRFNPFQPWTLNGNLIRCLLVDKSGAIWAGSDNGLNIYNPIQLLFTIIPPFATNTYERNRQVARVVTEDDNGNFWLGTTDGVSVVDSNFNQVAEWNNRIGQPDKIYYNSVRGIATDQLGRVWIATGKGVNRFDTKAKKMEFLGPADSLGMGFYFGAFKDREGNIWFCCRDGKGLYFYDKKKDKCFSIASHPHLKKLAGFGFRSFLEDSKGRYWMGLNGSGLAMYNPADHTISRWVDVADSLSAIAGSYVCDIKEDKSGKIWLSTFTGLSAVDPISKKVTNYTQIEGLQSNTVAPLAVDSLNRIWIGSSRGLMMLDSSRKNFTVFDRNDGLPHLAFNEQVAYITKKGHFMMPTFNGYIRFNPMDYRPAGTHIPVFISGLIINKIGNSLPFHQKRDTIIQLGSDKNAISFHLEAPHFAKPGGAWFAYRLSGFEKDWHYTQSAYAEYTNLPGGNYHFEYKASSVNGGWDKPHETLRVNIRTVFYKALWFWALVLILAASILYWIYRQRLLQQEKLFALQSKTQALEKEKAMVMYENLKQHLNPHFLFNSLTSLSSLIRLDQEMASDFLERMSKIYRYILKNRHTETVTLSEELNFVSNFIELQKARFETALVVNVDVEEEQLYKKIAPVTLQNLVENAIKHNMLSKAKPLTIDFFIEQDYLVVRNNLQRKNFVETSNRTGLHSMRDLYRYLSQRPLIIEEDESFFVVKVPLL